MSKQTEKCYIEEFCEAPVNDLAGYIGDWMDITTGWVEESGKTTLYGCKEDDEFEVSDTPIATFYGEPKEARRNALGYLFAMKPLLACEFARKKNPALIDDYDWLLDGSCRVWYGRSYKEVVKQVEGS